MLAQLKLKIPERNKEILFRDYEDLNVIWRVLEDYKNCTIEIVYDDVDQKLDIKEDINSDDIVTNKENTVNQDYVNLNFVVPKTVIFKQRFQDRVKTEVLDVLNSVYGNNSFILDSVKYEELDSENMNMIITIRSEQKDKLQYLDSNVAYIMKDLIDYYM